MNAVNSLHVGYLLMASELSDKDFDLVSPSHPSKERVGWARKGCSNHLYYDFQLVTKLHLDASPCT